jgi:hypothetical protein
MRVPLSLSLFGWLAGTLPAASPIELLLLLLRRRRQVFFREKKNRWNTEGTVAKCPPNNNINNNKPCSLSLNRVLGSLSRQSARAKGTSSVQPPPRRTIIAIIAAARNNCAKKAAAAGVKSHAQSD